MTISIRLDPETEVELRRLLVAQCMPLSDFVRDAIREKLSRSELPATPYGIGESLFGRYASGDTDRSVRRKELLRDRLREVHRR